MQTIWNLRFRYVSAKIKQKLNKNEKASRAITQSQKTFSSVYMLRALRRTLPTVGSENLVSLLGCKEQGIGYVKIVNVDERSQTNNSRAYSIPSFVEKLIDGNCILSVCHRRYIVGPFHPWFQVIYTSTLKCI